MKIHSKLLPSFEGCMVVALVLAGIAFLVWGYRSDTFSAQAISLLLCVTSFVSAIFVRMLSKRVEADSEFEAEAAAMARASWFLGHLDEPDDEEPAPPAAPWTAVRTAIQQFFLSFADLFDPQIKSVNQ